MTSEQLQSARSERWRQVSNPVLTADDARAWLDGLGFCLFLSRRSHASGLASVPTPSFVEAVAGAPSEASSREAIENATALLHRLAGDGSVVPLNLSGAAGAFGNGGAAGVSASDQPDFLVARAALPYVFSLVGGRNWKSGPGGKASPLMTEVWTLLNEKGARTAAEIQTELGREVTEAAVLRALLELWHGLRAIPVYDGEATRWELTQARFAAEMTVSQKVAQTTALSALVSLYLEAVIAASAEEIETFLSPLASRSRVREVVNGLSATRQLGLISVGAQPLFHVAGSLPEFAEEEVAAAKPVRSEFEPRHERPSREAGFERRPRAGREDAAARKPFERGSRRERGAERKGFDRGAQWKDRGRGGSERTGRERPGPAHEGHGFERRDRERVSRPFARGGGERSGARGERPGREHGRGGREEGERRPFGKKPFDKTAEPFGGRPFDRESARPSAGTGGKFPPKKFGAGKGRPWQDRGESRGAERPAGGGERPFRPRGEEERGGERQPGKNFGGAKFAGRGGSGPRADARGPRREGPGRGFERERPGEKQPFFRERDRKGGEQRPRESGVGSAGPQRREGDWKPKGSGGFSKQGRPAFRSSGIPGFKSSGKPGFKSGGNPGYKPGYGRERAPGREAGREGGREAGGEFRSEGRPAFKKSGDGKSAKPFARSGKPFGKSARPGGGAGKSFGKSARPFVKSGRPAFGKGKPGFGAKRPGGSKSGGPSGSKSGRPGGARPPFRKRRDEGGEDAG